LTRVSIALHKYTSEDDGLPGQAGNDTAEIPATFIYSARHARIVGQGVAQIVS
jgi:hypothetical protein